MPTFRVIVGEHLAHRYLVEAENREQAEERVRHSADDLEPYDTETIDWFVADVEEETEEQPQIHETTTQGEE